MVIINVKPVEHVVRRFIGSLRSRYRAFNKYHGDLHTELCHKCNKNRNLSRDNVFGGRIHIGTQWASVMNVYGGSNKIHLTITRTQY